MKSLMQHMKNKKGQILELIGGTVIAFMILIFVIFAVLYGISTLNPSSFFTAGSVNANATSSLTGNLTSGVAQFGSYIPTVLIVLGVVLVLSVIALLILYVRKMQEHSGGSSGGL